MASERKYIFEWVNDLEHAIRPSYYTLNASLPRRLWLWVRKRPHVPRLHGEAPRAARPLTLPEALSGVVLPPGGPDAR